MYKMEIKFFRKNKMGKKYYYNKSKYKSLKI